MFKFYDEADYDNWKSDYCVNDDLIKVKCCVCNEKIAYSEEDECYYQKLDKYICSLECEEEYFEDKNKITHIRNYFKEENEKEVNNASDNIRSLYRS